MNYRDEAARILIHYFRIAGVDNMSGDGAAEIRAAVDFIVDAAKDELRKEAKESR